MSQVATIDVGSFLPSEIWAGVVRHAPLISIDLIVRDAQQRVLLGLRANKPAQGWWFVPGGVTRKGETLDAAFARISETELGIKLARTQARFLGLYEHHYADSFVGDTFGTHYVVLPHLVQIADAALLRGDLQHTALRWIPIEALLRDSQVHENVKAYFIHEHASFNAGA